jgi:DNA repair protein RadC
LRDLPAVEKPRERLTLFGPGALATAELLAIIVATGRQGASALNVGQELMARFGLTGMAQASLDELCAVAGCGPAKAIQIKAALELGQRLAVHRGDERPKVGSPADVVALLGPEMSLLEQEHLRVVLLSAKNHVLAVHEVYKGSVSASPVRASEVFREAVRRNCPNVILVHNHPSGDPAPSPDDVRVTRQVVSAGRLLDIEVLDHVVIGHRRWVSMRERGLGF